MKYKDHEITFEEIREGDVVRTVRKFEDGYILTMEGKAHTLSPAGGWDEKTWRDENRNCVASEAFGKKADDTFYLLERNEPEDHIIISIGEDGQRRVENSSFDTETNAKLVAAQWTDQSYNGVVYKAVKLEVPSE